MKSIVDCQLRQEWKVKRGLVGQMAVGWPCRLSVFSHVSWCRSLKGASPGKALWHWQYVYTPGQCWSVSYAHTHSTFLLRSYVSSCWLWCAWTALILSLRCASTCFGCLLQLTGSAPSCCFWLCNRMDTVPPGFPSDQPAVMGPV